MSTKNNTPNRHTVFHTLEPVFDRNSRILLLGTMPSPKSRETGFYYNHPQNRFWPVLAALLGEETPASNEARRDFALRHRIALWDVLASCEIAGAGDASIRRPTPNDLRALLQTADIRAIFTTGQKAAELYRRWILPQTGWEAAALPSTSPANARMRLNDLIEAYRQILPYLER